MELVPKSLTNRQTDRIAIITFIINFIIFVGDNIVIIIIIIADYYDTIVIVAAVD